MATQAAQELDRDKGQHVEMAHLLRQAGECTRRELEEEKQLVEEKKKLIKERDKLAEEIQELQSEMEVMYDVAGARQLTSFSYACAFANSIRAAHVVDRDLPAVQEALQTTLMGYLQKNPPRDEYKWPLADLTTYNYNFSDFLEGIQVMDHESLIPSSTPLPESEPSTL